MISQFQVPNLGDSIIAIPKGSLCGYSRVISDSIYNQSNKCHVEVLNGEVPSRDKFKEKKEIAIRKG